jgi:hypothetical protein
MELKLNTGGLNSDRYPATLSFHAASRLAHSLCEWKREIDAEVASGRESADYAELVHDTIETEARHLIYFCRTQNLAQQTDYYDCIIDSLVDLMTAINGD